MNTIGTWLIALIALGTPFALSRRIRNDASLSGAVFLLLIVRQAVFYVHVFIRNLPTVSEDSLRFNAEGMDPEAIVRHFYGSFLQFFYEAFGGGSLMLGCQLSQVAFSLTIVVLVELAYVSDNNSKLPGLVMIFGLLPSCLLNTSVTSREPYQQLAFLTLVYAIVHLRVRGPNITGFLVVPSSIMLFLFHKGFAPFLVAYVPFALLWALAARGRYIIAYVAILAAVTPIWGPTALNSIVERSETMQRLSEQGLNAASVYTSKINEGRSSFSTTSDFSSPTAFATTYPLVFLQYLFSPFPWQVRGLIDLFGLIEGSLRFALFFFTCKRLKTADTSERRTLGFVFVSGLLLEAVWAAGTANWGTAIRHRVVAYGLFVISGGSALLKPSAPKEKKRKRGFRRRTARHPRPSRRTRRRLQ